MRAPAPTAAARHVRPVPVDHRPRHARDVNPLAQLLRGPGNAPKGGAGFLREIHGLRGLALGLVVAFHLFGHGRVSGGVDVFLVISAYLLTGSLDRALTRGTFSLPARYARTFVRLLPASLLVLVCVAGAGLLILPRTRWEGLLREVEATALLRQNVELATTGLSYGAAGSGASPLQHYWSLSVQGQFLLLWPLAALLLWLVLRLVRRSWSTRLFLFVSAVATGWSFAYALHLVSVDQEVAYYSFGARVWEMGLGAVAALILPGIKLSRPLATVVGWLGLALVLSSGFVIDGAHVFPGPWTLWPVLGALGVIASGVGAGGAGLASFLDLRPITKLADLAFPLYLWHWPILVLYLAWAGLESVTPTAAVGVLAASLALSWLTRRFVSAPIARRATTAQARPRGAFVVLAALLVVSLVVAGGARWGASIERARSEQLLAEGAGAEQHPGAEVLAADWAGPDTWSEPPYPSADVAPADLPEVYERGCVQDWRDGEEFAEVLVCQDDPGAHTVVLSGGSHAVQFYPALRAIADEAGWSLVVVDKDGCRLADEDPEITRGQACADWNAQALDVILGLDPDVVVTVGTETRSQTGEEGRERVYDGQVSVWQRLDDAGVPVIALRDTPRFEERVPDCLLQATDPAQCGRERSEVYQSVYPLLERTDLPESFVALDLSDSLCGPEWCEPVVGNVTAYRDGSHLTATYALTLTRALRSGLAEQAPWLLEGAS